VLVLGVSGAVLGSILPDLDLKLGIKHRTITHWLIWPVLIWFLLPALFPRAVALGWFLHLVADCLTVEGLAPFWPIRWRLRGFIRTGSTLEFVCLGGLFVILGVKFL
jgi:inner membrane protein